MDSTYAKDSAALQDEREGASRQNGTAALLLIAGCTVLLHLLTNQRYGFHRDELQFLSDARHLDWGFVAYPPLTPFVERVSMGIFGLSLVGLRLASVVAQGLVIVVTGLMARELGGGRLAQVTAALAVALAPLILFEGTEFQYTSFEILWMVLTAYCVIRLLQEEEPRWWPAIGVTLGLGIMTKYAILFHVAGILGGFLLTPARRYLLNRYFLFAAAITLVIVSPNLLWQIRHHFISYAFLHSIHVRDVGEGRANSFLRDQFLICTNTFAAPLWIGGLIAYFASRRYRPLGWMYVIPFLLFYFGKGRGYYMGATYPMLLAMGAVSGERWLAGLRTFWRRAIEVVFFLGLTVSGAVACAMIIPLATHGRLEQFALRNNDDLREEFGWDDLVKTVAGIRDSLQPEQAANAGILVGNYGEQGAIEILGPAYHLPPPISGVNSAWLRSYPAKPPSALIVVGISKRFIDRHLADCRLAVHRDNPSGVENEESRDHQDIYVCSGPRDSWPEFWKGFERFG
jgi:hypothetical protein